MLFFNDILVMVIDSIIQSLVGVTDKWNKIHEWPSCSIYIGNVILNVDIILLVMTVIWTFERDKIIFFEIFFYIYSVNIRFTKVIYPILQFPWRLDYFFTN